MTPNLSLAVEPFENNAVVFLPMAPGTSQDKAKGRVMLLLHITNHEAKEITLESVTISFPGSAVKPEVKEIYVNVKQNDVNVKTPVKIDSHKTAGWTFQHRDDDVIFELPAPGKIKLSIRCKGFDTAQDFGFELAMHQSPVLDGAYLFPAKAQDLALGEFWFCHGNGHAAGSQSFGYDMGVWRINHDNNTYSEFYPDKTQNQHYWIWGKPVYAMADGTVLHFLNDVPNNPVPKQEANWQAFKHGSAGNHFYIQHGDEVILYAHMQKGSLNKNLTKTDGEGKVIPVQVKAGDFLGLAGNSGHSSNPHLHIHSLQGKVPEKGPFRPIILQKMYTMLQDSLIKSPEKGFWSKVHKHGIAEGAGMGWPGVSMPEWPELIELGIEESAYQSLVTDYKERGFRAVWIDAYSLSSKTFFNVIFRPATGVSRVSRHGLLTREYQVEFDKWTKEGYRLVHIESYYSHTRKDICYAPMFEKSPGNQGETYHGLSQQEHQKKFDEFLQKGLVPVNISVTSVGGNRFYTALYENKNVGTWMSLSTLNAKEYQEAFDKNAAKGLHLVYVKTYEHLGTINFVGIWYENGNAASARHHLDKGEFDQHLIKQRKKNLYLRCISGYRNGTSHNYAAIWSK